MWDYDGHGPAGLWGVLMGIGWSITGFVAFLIWIGILILLVRFLLIGTRAAKLYLTQNGHDAGVFPKRPVAPTAPAAPSATTVTSPKPPVAKPPVAKPPVVKPPVAKPPAATKPAPKPPKPAGS